MKRKMMLVAVVLCLLMSVMGGQVSAVEGLEVIDARGENITLDSPPERIVSYMPSNTELLFHIGVGDRVVGVDDYSNYPPEVDALPKVGDAFNPDYEHIIDLEPDLVVAASYNTMLIDTLEGYGITVVATHSTSVEDAYQDMRMLGAICDVSERADELASYLESSIDEIADEYGDIPEDERPSVLYITGTYEGINTVGAGTFIHELMDNAGLHNVAGDDDGWLTYSEEEVIASDPEVIITTQGLKTSVEEYIERGSWQVITAVKNDAIYYVDGDYISRPGPRVIQAQETFVEIKEEERPEIEGEDIPGFTAVGFIAALGLLVYKRRR